MNRKKRLASVIAGILVVAMAVGFLASLAPVFAGAEAQKSSSQIKGEIQALENKQKDIEDQISALEAKISSNQSEIEEMVAQKSVLEQQIALLLEQIRTINEQITTYGVMIADKQKELVDAQTRLAELNAKNKERIRAMEEEGRMSYWSVLFQANSFADLLDRINMIEEIADSDQRRLEEMNEAAKAVETARQELEAEKQGLEATRADLEASQAELDGKKAQAEAVLNDLLAMGEEYSMLLMDASEKSSELEKEQMAKEAEYKKAKDREYQQWLEANPPAPPAPPKPAAPPAGSGGHAGETNTSNGITWQVPISYTMVSSPFGWRTHPIYNTPKLHAGIDLAAPTGTPIVATRSGVVSVAAYEAGGAGYYVNINHMDGYVSRYMHMTNFIVSPGQNVSAGQVIGYCGSTGASTGPHLHFGIYRNGAPQNPANYINF